MSSNKDTAPGNNKFDIISDIIIISTDATSVLNNIVHEKITQVSWCNEFSIPVSTQTTLTIKFNVGIASTFAI